MKNIFKFLFLALPTVGVALFSLMFLIPPDFVESAFSKFVPPHPTSIIVMLTIGVTLFFKSKIESFIKRIVARRPDRCAV